MFGLDFMSIVAAALMAGLVALIAYFLVTVAGAIL